MCFSTVIRWWWAAKHILSCVAWAVFYFNYVLKSSPTPTFLVQMRWTHSFLFGESLLFFLTHLPPKQLYVCMCWNTDIYCSFFHQFSKVWEQIENRTVLTHCHINCNNWLDYFCMIYWLILLGNVFTLPTVIQISMLKNCTSEVVPQSLSRFRNTQTQSTERHTYTHINTHTHLEDSCQLQWCQSVRATWTHVAGNLCLSNRVNVSIVYVV